MVPAMFPRQNPLQLDLESLGRVPVGGGQHHPRHGIQHPQASSETCPQAGHGPTDAILSTFTDSRLWI